MDYYDILIQNDLMQFVLLIIITLLFVGIAYIILRRIISIIAGKKKSHSRYLLRKLGLPIFLLIIVIGSYFSISSLELLDHMKDEINNIFFVIITLIIALVTSRITKTSLGLLLKIKKGLERTPKLISSFLSIIIYLIAIVIILGYFQLDITPLLAGVGVGALAIGLALQSTLSNFFAGLHIVSDQPIKVGDFIELDKDTSGFVEDIGWRSTRIKTMMDNLIVIPNGKLADSTILNYSMPKQDLSFWIPCGVAYDSDLEKVEKISLEVAKEIQENYPGAVKDYDPLFRFKEFNDSNIDFIIILRVEEPMKRYVVRNEFIKKLKQRFDKEGIEISWPIRKIYNIK